MIENNLNVISQVTSVIQSYVNKVTNNVKKGNQFR